MMLNNYLTSIKDKIVKYCFWCLNQSLEIENFPQPLFENSRNIDVEGLYVKWYNNKRELRSFNGTTSKIDLFQGLKAFSIYSYDSDKIIKEEVGNLICEILILHNFVKMNNKTDWIVGKHGLLNKTRELLFLPNEFLKQSLKGKSGIIRFESLIFEDIYFEKKINLNSKICIKLDEILNSYFSLEEYKLYKEYKKKLFESNQPINFFKLPDKILKVLRAEFFNLHWILLIIKDKMILKKKIIKQKSDMMDYITNNIVNIGSVLDNFRKFLNTQTNTEFLCDNEHPFEKWNSDKKCESVVKSNFFNLDNKKVSTIKYLKFKRCYIKELGISKKDFKKRIPPKDVNFPFKFTILRINNLIFIYPDLSLTPDFLFLIEFILDIGVSTLTKYLEYKDSVLYIPAFTSVFHCIGGKRKILTVNKYGIFDYENGIHEISDNQIFPKIFDNPLIINKPFLCVQKNECIAIVTNPQNPFKSKKQERYMWARHPKIAKKWTKKYGKKKKKKKK